MVRIAQGSTTESVRRHNLSIVLRQLHLSGALSRAELTARTELNRSTVKALVHELSSLDLVAEGDPDLTGTRGRPSALVDVRADRFVALAAEIAVDSIAVAVVGLGGHVHGVRRVDRRHDRLGPDEAAETVCELATALLPAASRIVGVGVAVVGIVRRDDGFVHIAPNLGWADVPLGTLIADRLAGGPLAGDVSVMVANEADLGLLAEHARGAAKGFDDVVYLSGEVGLGGGVLVGGRRLTGASGYAGEIGHLPVNPDGRRCGCGGQGCWETEVGTRALLRLADAGHKPGEDAVTGVVAGARHGDPSARRAVTEVGRWLGIGLAGLINVFDPERVVLGGMYGRAFDVFEPVVTETLETRALTTSAQVDVVPAALGFDAPLMGAAELAFAPLLEQPDRAA